MGAYDEDQVSVAADMSLRLEAFCFHPCEHTPCDCPKRPANNVADPRYNVQTESFCQLRAAASCAHVELCATCKLYSLFHLDDLRGWPELKQHQAICLLMISIFAFVLDGQTYRCPLGHNLYLLESCYLLRQHRHEDPLDIAALLPFKPTTVHIG